MFLLSYGDRTHKGGCPCCGGEVRTTAKMETFYICLSVRYTRYMIVMDLYPKICTFYHKQIKSQKAFNNILSKRLVVCGSHFLLGGLDWLIFVLPEAQSAEVAVGERWNPRIECRGVPNQAPPSEASSRQAAPQASSMPDWQGLPDYLPFINCGTSLAIGAVNFKHTPILNYSEINTLRSRIA